MDTILGVTACVYPPFNQCQQVTHSPTSQHLMSLKCSTELFDVLVEAAAAWTVILGGLSSVQTRRNWPQLQRANTKPDTHQENVHT